MQHHQYKKQLLKKPLTKYILEKLLQKTGDGLTEFIDLSLSLRNPRRPLLIKHGQKNDVYRERKQLLRAIRDLRKKKLIIARETGRKLFLALTDEGRACFLKQQVQQAPKCNPNECVIVIFDIPETERHVRLLFRRFLKECTFKQLQQSVWMCERSVLSHVQQFIRDQKISGWVRAFIARDALL